MQEDSYICNSKNSEKLPYCIKLVLSYCVKISTFYHIPTFLGIFGNRDKLSVLKQQHVDLQNKHGKGYPCHFY